MNDHFLYHMVEITTEADSFWDYLIDNGVVSEETLRVVTTINGYSVDTLNDVLYAVTGYRSLDQLKEADEDD